MRVHKLVARFLPQFILLAIIPVLPFTKNALKPLVRADEAARTGRIGVEQGPLYYNDAQLTLIEQALRSLLSEQYNYNPEEIYIYRPKVVEVWTDGSIQKLLTFDSTPREAILGASIALGDYDEVTPGLDTPLTPSLGRIVIVRVSIVTEITGEEIPFGTRDENSGELEMGVVQVGQEGSMGLKETTYQYVYKDGVLFGEGIVKEEIVKEPIDKVVWHGTKKILREIEINGRIHHYYAKLWMWSTSYDKNCKGCSETTATGAKLRHGIVAVDPKVIPLHTKVYVPGYGMGQAEDTGGSIKGMKIDLAFDDVKNGWWSARWTDVYLLED